jgi:hypothetical protein
MLSRRWANPGAHAGEAQRPRGQAFCLIVGYIRLGRQSRPWGARHVEASRLRRNRVK